MSRRRAMLDSGPKGPFDVGNAVFWTGSKYVSVKYEEIDSVPSSYKPVAVICVPTSHNVYGDGCCGAISLRFMTMYEPEFGLQSSYPSGTSYECFLNPGHGIVKELGYTMIDLGIQPRPHIYSEATGAYIDLSSTKAGNFMANGSTSTTTGTGDVTPTAISSPYKSDGVTKNSIFFATATNKTYFTDFGPDTHNKIVAFCDAHPEYFKNWRSLRALGSYAINNGLGGLTNTGGAQYTHCNKILACHKYKAAGDSSIGNWYAAPAGEIMYLMYHATKIRNTMVKLYNKYGEAYVYNSWVINDFSTGIPQLDGVPITPLNNSTAEADVYMYCAKNYNFVKTTIGIRVDGWNSPKFNSYMAVNAASCAWRKFKFI